MSAKLRQGLSLFGSCIQKARQVEASFVACSLPSVTFVNPVLLTLNVPLCIL